MEWFNYLLKVSACSVFFFGFYLVVLKKLTFFKINRFYLLLTLLLSFVIPALQFTVEREVNVPLTIENPIVVQDESIVEQTFDVSPAITTAEFQVAEPFNWLSLTPYVYAAIVFGLLAIAFWRLFQLIKHAKQNTKQLNGLKIVTKTAGFTNCSFFNYVFIDENSLTETELRVLLTHEEVHARMYHSIDKLLLMLVKAILWFNPIVYLYDKALEQTHEYEADEATSQNFGTEHYANLLLKLAVTKNEMPLIHNFVKSPIKERIKMLFNSKSKDMKKLIYLLALPIGLGLLWSFTIDVVEVPVKGKNEKQFTLVLDAGHGGKQNGAEANGYKEKDITLAFAHKIKALAEAKGIKVVTSRENDQYIALTDRVKMKGDYLLSLHVNSEPTTNGTSKNGIEIYTPSSDKGLVWAKSNSMQNYLYEQLKTVEGIKTASKPIQQRLVLLENANAPGVLIELGYITNKEDVKVITNEAKQNELAAAIVEGILVYKDKAPTDEAFDKNDKAAIAPTNVTKQDLPFIQRTITATNNSHKSEQITLNTLNGKPVFIKIYYNYTIDQKPSVWVYANDKLYSEEEALKLDKSFIAKLSEKRGYASIGDYDLPALKNNKLGYLFWFGNEPKLSAATAKNRAYYQKYNGTTVEGKIIGFTFSTVSKVMDGFLVKTNTGETLKANVEAKFAKQTQAKITKGDNVAIKIYNAAYFKNSEYPVLTSYKISKDGKLIFDRWPKTAANNKVLSTNENNNIQNQQAKIFAKPLLISSTSVRIDAKNEISYSKNAKMRILEGTLLAEELTFDQKNEKVIAEKASFTTKNGDVIKGGIFTFDWKACTYQVDHFPLVTVSPTPVFDLLSKLNYKAMDSTIVSKTANTVTLYGKAYINYGVVTLSGDKIEVNKNSNVITAYNAELLGVDNNPIKGKVISYNPITKKGKVTDVFLRGNYWDRIIN